MDALMDVSHNLARKITEHTYACHGGSEACEKRFQSGAAEEVGVRTVLLRGPWHWTSLA